jgi:cyclophilin family peptidyl-prolyl cis-trans isomerase
VAPAAERASHDAPPAVADFQKLQENWRRCSLRLQELKALFEVSNPAQRSKIRADMAAAVDDANTALVQMLPALEAAYEAQPKDRALTDLMASIARLGFDGDRYEIVMPLAKLLARDFPDKASVQNLAGLTAYELVNLKEAQAYLERAKELGGLGPRDERVVERLLENMPQRQSLVDAEMARRAEESRLNNLPRVKLQTSRGDIVVELFEDDVPNTVASFVGLVEDGFYDGLEFFRVDNGFGAMTGSPSNDGTGGPGYEIERETGARGPRPLLRGTLSMIPLTERTNGSQFLITLRSANVERLEGKQTVFGRVVEGMDVVERLHRVDVRGPARLFDPDRILEATVLRKRDHKYVGLTLADMGQEKYLEGMKYFAQQNFPESEKLLRQAIAYAPDNSRFMFALAGAIMNQKKYEEGEKYMRETLRLNPKHPKAHYFLAYALATQNRREEAEQHCLEAIRLDPGNGQAKELLKRLRLK